MHQARRRSAATDIISVKGLRGFDDELKLAVAGLPHGVTVKCAPGEADDDSINVEYDHEAAILSFPGVGTRHAGEMFSIYYE